MTDPTNPSGPPPEPVPPSAPPLYPVAPPPVADPTTPFAVPPVGAPPAGEPPTTQVTSGGGGGGKGKLLLAVAVLVVLVGGAYATLQLLGGDDRGAASPEQAGEQLVAALNDSDVLAAIDLLPEGERDVLLDLADLADESRRLGVLDDAFTLDGFNGVTFEIADPEFDVEELSDADGRSLSLVSLVAGTAAVEVDGEELTGNVGEVLEEAFDLDDADDFDDEVDIEDLLDDLREQAEDDDFEFSNPFSVAVVEEDGRFFPSIGFTVAEFGRADANRFGDEIDAPDLDDGIEPEGGDSPEEAVQALLDAATSLDAEAALAVLDPGELGAAQVYAPLFGDLDGGDASGIEIELTDARVEGAGRGARRVIPTGLVVSADLDGLEFEFTLEDECIELTAEADGDDFELERTCFDDDIDSDIADDVDIPDEVRELVAAFLPIEGGIVTVERDGEHFVSPLRTVTQAIAGVVDDIEREDIEEGGIIFDAFDGALSDEFEDLGDSLDEAFEDADPDEALVAVLALLQDLEIDVVETIVSAPGLVSVGAFGIGVTLASSFEESFEEIEVGDFEDEFEDDFDDETATTQEPTEDLEVTGPSGPNGELLVGDVVGGTVEAGGVATFTAIGAASDGLLVGAVGFGGADLTITVIDAATGEELAFDDDFNAPDPEALVFLEEGQAITIEVREFGGDAADFVVYFQPI